MLQQLSLSCPNLLTLDASFCTQLNSSTLGDALSGTTALQSLLLSVCSALDACMLNRAFLPHLTLLDLSYSNVQVCCMHPSQPSHCWALNLVFLTHLTLLDSLTHGLLCPERLHA